MFKGKLVKLGDDSYCVICEHPKFNSNGVAMFLTLCISSKQPYILTFAEDEIDTIYTEISEVEAILGSSFSKFASFLRY